MDLADAAADDSGKSSAPDGESENAAAARAAAEAAEQCTAAAADDEHAAWLAEHADDPTDDDEPTLAQQQQVLQDEAREALPPLAGYDTRGRVIVTRSRCKKAPYWLTEGEPRYHPRQTLTFLFRCGIDRRPPACAVELDAMDSAGKGQPGNGAWSGTQTWDASCCCHPLTGVRHLHPGPGRDYHVPV